VVDDADTLVLHVEDLERKEGPLPVVVEAVEAGGRAPIRLDEGRAEAVLANRS
jgi:hypothetical protein